MAPNTPLVPEAAFHSPRGRTPPAVSTLRWVDLKFEVPGPKEILAGVSGQLKPGELACILGPSGAGKTTLLNVLAGRQRTQGGGYSLTGAIELGDQVLAPEQMRKRVGFVMQDDALCGTQTVRESLLFSAALKLPRATRQERESNVNELILALGLGSCADTRIGSALQKGVSGGERKRTSVGVELITNPALILLDEPTSGLDSFAACQLVKLLKQLACGGRIVCCTIHQPSSEVFELFDRAMCLRKGAMMYQGCNSNLMQELDAAGFKCPSGYNVADWLLYIAQTQDAVQIMDDNAEQTSDFRRRVSSESVSSFDGSRGRLPPEVPHAAFSTQVRWLAKRELSSSLRDKTAMGARMGTTVGQAILYALIFPGIAKSSGELERIAREAGPYGAQSVIESNMGDEFRALVSISIAAFFGAAQPLILSFPLERPVFLREYASNMYSVVAYFLAKTAVEVVVTLVQDLLLVLITYWVLSLRANFLELLFALWLMAISAGSMSLWLGCMVSSTSSAVQLMPAIAVPQIIFSGLFIKADQLKIPLRWIQYVCAIKYAINLLCIGEYADLEISLQFGPASIDYHGTQFLKSQDIDKDLWWFYVLALVAIFFVFRILAMLALRKKGKYVF